MFSIIYFFIYLIYQGRWPWYILVTMIPKERSSWASVPWMFQYIVTSYPPFGNHAKMGIDNLVSPSIYPSIRGSASQNKRSPFDRSSNSFFWVGYFDKI